MKRTWRVLLSLLLLAAPAAVQAQYTVSTNSDTTINIVRDTGAFGNVSVPASINSLPVTTVGQYAFANISNLTSVVFPSGVAGIGGFAFYLSTNLTNVGIPSTVTNIGTNVFADCYSLQAISVDPANLFYSSVGGALFDYSQITLLQFPEARSGSFTIPNTVTSVGNYAFAFCQGLTGVTIPSSVTNLGNFAFDFCTNLSSVTIGSGVTNIGAEAFFNCTSLASVVIGGGVTNFGSAVFAGCTNLSAIMVDPANSFYTSSNGVLFNKSQTTLLQCPEALAGGSYTIPAGVTTIESNAFQYCLLTNLTIPNTVTNIGDYAFAQSRLTSVTINDGVPDIGTNAFYECYSLTNVLIPASVTNIEDYAFESCTSLRAIYFGGNAPAADATVFIGDNATVYYLPGATGWGSAFAGLPAVQEQAGSLQVTISPLGAITNGALWQVDAGVSQNSGATVTNLFVGNHTVSFSAISGWITPASQTVSVSANSTADATGVYVQETGSLQVTITPAGAVAAGAQWQVDGGTFQTNGATVSNLVIGNHTISFSTVSGWITPANQNVSISYDSTTNATGVYVQETGALQVFIAPSGAVSAGAQWQVDGGAWQASGATVSNLVIGSHNISYSSISGWLTPTGQSVTISYNTTTNATGLYVQETGALQVFIAPTGAVTAGAQWQVDGGAWQASGATVSNLVIGSHNINYSSISGWLTPTGQSVTISYNTNTNATGVYVQETGSLQVFITPSGAVSAGAQWQVDGGAWQNSGATVANLPVGSHNINYSGITGWLTPTGQSVTISYNTTTNATGVYVQETGSLQVTITPAGAVSAGAQWQVDSGTLQNSGNTVGNLIVGTHTVSFSSISGWTTPANQNVTIAYDATTNITGNYVQLPASPFIYTTNADNTVTLAGYTGPGGDVVIPATNGDGLTVADIGAEAFMGDTLLTNIAFPASIVSVGDEAFANCSSLLTVALPNGVTNLGEGAFSDCSSLTNATLGLVLTDIESNTFAQCADLTFFTVPGSVTNIDDYAFDTCTDLQSVYFLGNAPNADALAFNNDIFTNYYLPGASGWSNTFAGAPVILWDPQIANDPSFGISNNQFGFNITGTNNFTVVVAASTNLNNPAWVPLTNGTLTNYLLYFSDPQWTNYPNRFYMLQMP